MNSSLLPVYSPTTSPINKCALHHKRLSKPSGLCFWLTTIVVLVLIIISSILTPIFYMLFNKIYQLEHTLEDISDSQLSRLPLPHVLYHIANNTDIRHSEYDNSVKDDYYDEGYQDGTKEDDLITLYNRILHNNQKSLTRGNIRNKRSTKKIPKFKRKNKLMKKIQQNIKKLNKRVDELQGRKTAISRFTAQLDPTLAAIMHKNEGQVLNTNYGTVQKGAVLPTPDQRYRFWSEASDTDRDMFEFNKQSGTVTVKKAGTFLIYAQVLYHDSGPRTAYAIRASNNILGRPSVLVKCLATAATIPVDSPEGSTVRGVSQHEVYHMCSTVSVLKLQENQVLDMFPLYVAQYVVPDGAATFWGMVYLG